MVVRPVAPVLRLDAGAVMGTVAMPMRGTLRLFSARLIVVTGVLFGGLFGCSASQAPKAKPPAKNTPVGPTVTFPSKAAARPSTGPVVRYPSQPVILLGIDVLEADKFTAIAGKKIGLLTHPAGVNRNGETTISVLRRAPQSKLVALYGPEHGIYGDAPAEIKVASTTDPKTGLPVYSLYGQYRKPTKAMLKGLDALVIDLQDIGSRSYTYISCMKAAMEACFENNVEVIVLDRPNPLGGLKADGPPLDAQWVSYVGAFRVPYVHGLTIAELARMAAAAPGVLNVTPEVRAKGKLTIVPMRGWRRSMRWPETGLTFVPTSPFVQDYPACVGYAMTGLGTYFDPKAKFDMGFRHGVGDDHAFRGISHKTLKSDAIERALVALRLPGLSFRRISVPGKDGKARTGVYIEVSDYDDWNPTELSAHLMRLACSMTGQNPFNSGDASGFIRHMGSQAFLDALKRDGAKTDVAGFVATWRHDAKRYQELSKRYWLYQ